MHVTGEQIRAHQLPERKNPCLNNPPPYHELVENRRLNQSSVAEKITGGPFSYVSLKVALPQLDDHEIFGTGSQESYYLMRRSKDGFVSATGMFKASFPWARMSDIDHEKQFVRSRFKDASKDETAGSLWVSPVDALSLADDYGIKLWIEALLDNKTVLPSDHRKRAITPPPPFFRGVDGDSVSVVSPGPAPRRRSARSASPGKRIPTPRKSRAAKAGIVRDNAMKRGVAPILETEEITTINTAEKITLAPTLFTNGTVPSSKTPIKKKRATMKVEVDEALESHGDTEVKTTHVKVELPQSPGKQSTQTTEELIAAARQMVAEARKLEGGSTFPRKRSADEMEGDEVNYDQTEMSLSKERTTKRSKTLEAELRKERVKNRALLGLSATLAIGALLPYVL